jgi:undecaprenyl diphosphate synthase
MDGNGRWAQARGLPRTAGHRAGIQNVRRAVETVLELKIGVLTLYAFSTENWQRPREEVGFLMQYCEDFVHTEMDELHQRNVKIQFLGRREPIRESLLEVIDRSIQLTRHNTGLILNFALNYGGRAEIIDATRRVIQACGAGRLAADDLDEETFAHYLYTAGLPDPDLIIRTAGEQRLSNFLIWQAPGAVFWTTPTFWPDFTKAHLLAAIAAWRRQADQDRPKE